MKKLLAIFILFPVLLQASYNPFFKEVKPIPKPKPEKPVPKVEPKPIIKTVIQEPPKPKIPAFSLIPLKYFGFLETKKGRFALIEINGKNIIVKQQDPLYVGSKKYKIDKITSNTILIKDPYKRVQSIYFSSER